MEGNWNNQHWKAAELELEQAGEDKSLNFLLYFSNRDDTINSQSRIP
jgi:hypothetical protein